MENKHDKIFKGHKIISQERNRIVCSREEDSAFCFSVMFDGLAKITVSGDISTVTFGNYRGGGGVVGPIRWLGSIEACDSYVQEKALIGMGCDCHNALMEPHWKPVKDFLDNWSKIEREVEDDEKADLIDSVKPFQDGCDWNSFLAWSDNFYVRTCCDEDIRQIASRPSSRLEIAHAALRCAWRLT